VSATGVPSSLNEAVQRAAEEIKKKAAEKPSPTPNAN
jgi:hypothetical protein